MFPPALGCSGGNVHVMLGQERCQAGVDLVETPVQDAQAFFLDEDALTELVEAA